VLHICAAVAVAVGLACASVAAQKRSQTRPLTPEDRLAILRRSQVWTPTNVPAMDIRIGPPGKGGFAPGETVTCTYIDRKMKGHSPKFECALGPDDEVKVKYGSRNGEAYGEVAATRLLWALGFGADRMYPVHVICRGCPEKLKGEKGPEPNESFFDVAAIERKAPGEELVSKPDEGWSWRELDLVQETAGGAPTAHRDALKLLAVLMQHGDNKPEQQRLVCLDDEYRKPKKGTAGESAREDEPVDPDEPKPAGGELCLHPFMLINDLGLTFGRVDMLNRNSYTSVNYDRWSQTRIWKDERCVGNLPKSLSGSMHDPVISEQGRAFLAALLARLTDVQLQDLFTIARFAERLPANPKDTRRTATVDDWVRAFKQKRDEIANRRCGE
jgi:hypothetical protein